MGTAVEPPSGTPAETSGGRIDQFRARAEAARRRYEEMAQRQPLYGIPLTCLATYAARQGMLLASAIAFRLFFWVLPVILLGVSLLSGIGRSDLYQTATDATGITGVARAEVLRALSQGGQSWWILAVISLFGVLWTTMLLRRALVLVNAHLWGATFVKTRTRQLILSVFFFIALVSLIAFSSRAVARLDGLFPGGFLADDRCAGRPCRAPAGWQSCGSCPTDGPTGLTSFPERCSSGSASRSCTWSAGSICRRGSSTRPRSTARSASPRPSSSGCCCSDSSSCGVRSSTRCGLTSGPLGMPARSPARMLWQARKEARPRKPGGNPEHRG